MGPRNGGRQGNDPRFQGCACSPVDWGIQWCDLEEGPSLLDVPSKKNHSTGSLGDSPRAPGPAWQLYACVLGAVRLTGSLRIYRIPARPSRVSAQHWHGHLTQERQPSVPKTVKSWSLAKSLNAFSAFFPQALPFLRYVVADAPRPSRSTTSPSGFWCVYTSMINIQSLVNSSSIRCWKGKNQVLKRKKSGVWD